jgi:hypothetical protein
LKDSDCCGGDPSSGLPGAGNGSCQLDPSGKIGLCINPTNGSGNACNPEGNVCHYLADTTYMCSSSSARSDCCGPLTPKSLMCVLDGLGVPRCLGNGGVCAPAGATCASAADCCNQLPCIPDATGALHCLTPPDGGPACQPVSGGCTIDGDCCPGGICNKPRGSSTGTCASNTPPPPGSGGYGGEAGAPNGGSGNYGGGGSGGSPGCSLYGQICTVDGDCCNGIPCTNGICLTPIK